MDVLIPYVYNVLWSVSDIRSKYVPNFLGCTCQRLICSLIMFHIVLGSLFCCCVIIFIFSSIPFLFSKFFLLLFHILPHFKPTPFYGFQGHHYQYWFHGFLPCSSAAAVPVLGSVISTAICFTCSLVKIPDRSISMILLLCAILLKRSSFVCVVKAPVSPDILESGLVFLLLILY